MIELVLPYPPSINDYKKVGRIAVTKKGKFYQKRFNSPETNAFYYQVFMLTRSQASKFIQDSTISLEVTIWVHPPDNHRADIDNRIKVTLDSLQRAKVIPDDYQISRLVVERKDIIKHGQIIVRIKPHDDVTRTSTQETVCI
jgi:Holliday junction resolvase RusA-like endonuclease